MRFLPGGPASSSTEELPPDERRVQAQLLPADGDRSQVVQGAGLWPLYRGVQFPPVALYGAVAQLG